MDSVIVDTEISLVLGGLIVWEEALRSGTADAKPSLDNSHGARYEVNGMSWIDLRSGETRCKDTETRLAVSGRIFPKDFHYFKNKKRFKSDAFA